MKKIFLIILIIATLLFSANLQVVNSYAIVLLPAADGHSFQSLQMLDCSGYFPGTPRIENGIKVGSSKYEYSPTIGCDIGEWNKYVGLIEFKISHLKIPCRSSQVKAKLYLTVKEPFYGTRGSPGECFSLYSMQGELENGFIELDDANNVYKDFYYGGACAPFKTGDTIIFDVGLALEHDLCDYDQTGFSGFVLKANTDDLFPKIEFYDHTNLLYAPKLKISLSCAIDQIYGEHSAETELLRSLRDNILSKTQEGRELIKWYYLWSPMVVQAMEVDDEFKAELKDLIDELLPMVAGAVE